MPGPDGARLQGPLLPGVRLRAVVLRVAARRRPDLHLPVRAPGAQAPAVGITDPAVAPEVPVAPAVARPPRRGVPRRPLRDDPSRPDRGHGLGRRRLRRGGPPVQRRDSTSATWATLNVEHWTAGMERLLRFRDASTATTASTTWTSRPCNVIPSARFVGCTPGSDEPVTDAFEQGMRRWWEANAEQPGGEHPPRRRRVRARPRRGARPVRRVLGEDPRMDRRDVTAGGHDDRESDLYYDPYDVEHQRRPVSHLSPAAGRGARLLQRALRRLGPVAGTTTWSRRWSTGRRSRTAGATCSRAHPVEHRAARRGGPLRGPAAARDAPRPDVHGSSPRAA